MCGDRCYSARSLRGPATAFIVSAVTVYFIKAPHINQSRSLLIGTFGLFVLFSAVLAAVHASPRVSAARSPAERPIVLVVGQSARSDVLKSHLSNLCGFSRWHALVCPGGFAEYSLAVTAALDDAAANGRVVQAVIIDARRHADTGTCARGRGWYVRADVARSTCSRSSPGPVRESTPLLGELFEAPVVRVRCQPPNRAERHAKRALDVVLSSVGLVAFALPMGAMRSPSSSTRPVRSSTVRSASVSAAAPSASSSSAAWWLSTTTNDTASTSER